MMIKFCATLVLSLILPLALGCQHKNVVLYERNNSLTRFTTYGDRSEKNPQFKPAYTVDFQSFEYGFGNALIGENKTSTHFLVVGGSSYHPTTSGFLTKRDSLVVSEAALLPNVQPPFARYTIRPKKPLSLTTLLKPVLENYKDLTFVAIEADVRSLPGENYPALILLIALRDEELVSQPKDPLFHDTDVPGDSMPILRGVVCRLTDRNAIDLSNTQTLDFRLSRIEEFTPDLLVVSGDMQLYVLKDIENR